MRLSKFLIVILAVTLTALFYVHQQSKIIQMAYQEQENLILLQGLVDKGNELRHTISCRKSLVSLAELWQDQDFEWPHRTQLVSLSVVGGASGNTEQIKETESIFTRFLGLKSKAEATPLKPR